MIITINGLLEKQNLPGSEWDYPVVLKTIEFMIESLYIDKYIVFLNIHIHVHLCDIYI